LSVHWFSSGGDRSHPERSEGWNAEGELMTSDGDTRVKRIWMPPERLPSLMPYRGVELEL
jgi:hypothetical protein